MIVCDKCGAQLGSPETGARTTFKYHWQEGPYRRPKDMDLTIDLCAECAERLLSWVASGYAEPARD